MAQPEIAAPCLAEFSRVLPGGGRTLVLTVPFNPESLQLTVSNTLRAEGTGAKVRQFVDKADPKLSLQLVFDSTDTGADVRAQTGRLAALVNPFDEAAKAAGGGARTVDGQQRVPPNVEFSWGNFAFTGLIESFKETLDYFSANGVPLRSVVDLAMVGQQPALGPRRAATGGTPEAASPPVVPAAGGPAAAAGALGVPEAARDIARANGADSLRFSAGATLALPQGGSLRAEAAFASGAGAATGTGLGLDLGSAAGSAFGGLRARVEAASPLPGPQALFGASASAGLSVGAGIGVGGAASAGAAASASAEVGSAADLARLIRFE